MFEEIRFAAVGLGHRGRHMFQTGLKAAEKIVPGAACDINADLWYKSQRNEPPLAETFPDTKFYEDFDQMLANEKIIAKTNKTEKMRFIKKSSSLIFIK